MARAMVAAGCGGRTGRVSAGGAGAGVDESRVGGWASPLANLSAARFFPQQAKACYPFRWSADKGSSCQMTDGGFGNGCDAEFSISGCSVDFSD